MTDTKGNIRARKLGNTGITEDILKKIADAKGGHLLAIVELKADTIHEQINGDDRTVDFLIDTIEPVVDGKLDGAIVDHVRNIQAALYRNRKLHDDGDQLPLDGSDGPEPTVKDVLAQGAGLVEVDDDGEVTGLWDGNTEPDDDGDDEQDDESESSGDLAEAWVDSQHGEEPEEADPDDPSYEPHGYVDGPGALCRTCGGPAGWAVHQHDDEPVPA